MAAGIMAGAIMVMIGVPAVASPDSNQLVEPERTARVTIHAAEQGAEITGPADGRHDPMAASAPGLPGLQFSAQQMTEVLAGGRSHSLDLTTSAGWRNALLLDFDPRDCSWTFDGEVAEAVFAEVSHTAGTSRHDGLYQPAVIEDMTVGLYYFSQTDAPADVTRSDPWMMTVPLTHPTDRNSWLYDIHVYPKNTTTAIAKSVDDTTARAAGDKLDWAITADIPLIANPDLHGERFLPPHAYVIEDRLDPRLMTTMADDVRPVLLGTDVQLDKKDYSVRWIGGEQVSMRITLNERGLDKLGTAVSLAQDPASVKVEVVIGTRVRMLPRGEMAGTVGDGLIHNQASLYLSQHAIDTDTPILSPEPVTKWGDILIEKVDARTPDMKLSGAAFSVYASEDDARSRTRPLSIAGKTEFETDGDGLVRISGLRYTNWAANDIARDPEARHTYWVAETKAPSGYELLAEPLEIEVDAAQQTVSAATRVENAPHNIGFRLPLTGAGGTWLFTGGGILLAGIGLLLASRRRGRTSETDHWQGRWASATQS